MTYSVIESIRNSLGRGTGTPLLRRPEIFPARQPESVDVEIDQFLNEVNKLSGVGKHITTQEIAERLKELVCSENIHKATLWDTDLLKQLGIEDLLRETGVELISPNASKQEMELCDLGITECDYLLPETGTIVLRSSNKKPRGVSLLPRIHLAIVIPQQLRADLHQVFAEAKDAHYLVFVTGPSRTADIELTVTLGVHGPKELYVWMLKGSI